MISRKSPGDIFASSPANVTLAPVVETSFKSRVQKLGKVLVERSVDVLESIPEHQQGPIQLARTLKMDKATASRLLRAAAMRDPFAALQQIPGPEPLRGFAQAASSYGVEKKRIESFLESVGHFDQIIRDEAGDRSGFDSILAAFVPESRDAFELKRKQAVYRAMSQLKGVVAQTNIVSAIIHPSPTDAEKMDIVWIFGYLGLQRLRPGVPVRISTRRVSTPHAPGETPKPRRPLTIDGREASGFEGLLLGEGCTQPFPELKMEQSGDFAHYLLAGDAFGPKAACDLTFAELNRGEVPRFVAQSGKRRFVYTDVPIPVERLIFDAIIHEDVLGPAGAQLSLYDTSTRGIADINDRARDIDRIDLSETLRPLGKGIDRCRVSEVPWYDGLLERITTTLGYDTNKLVANRTVIDFPLHATQIAITYEAQVKG